MSHRSLVESLENRRLFHGAEVTSILADNRGEVQVTFDTPVLNVSRNTVVFFTAGADGEINTNDDVRKRDITVRNRGDGRVTIFGRTDVNALYRIRLLDDIVREDDGGALDGEFSGTFPSGDGTEGGNLSFAARRDRGGRPTLRFSTSLGTANVKLFRDTPGIGTTIANFIDYANAAKLDGTIIHRSTLQSEQGYGIIQGGGFYSTAEEFDSAEQRFVPSDTVDTVDPIELQAGVVSNTRGTLAMARTGEEDSATSQYFFNTTDNAFFDTSGGGYAAFGQISSSAGYDTIDAINAATITSEGQSGTFGELPQSGGEDIVVRRVALLHKVEAL